MSVNSKVAQLLSGLMLGAATSGHAAYDGPEPFCRYVGNIGPSQYDAVFRVIEQISTDAGLPYKEAYGSRRSGTSTGSGPPQLQVTMGLSDDNDIGDRGNVVSWVSAKGGRLVIHLYSDWMDNDRLWAFAEDLVTTLEADAGLDMASRSYWPGHDAYRLDCQRADADARWQELGS